MSNPTFDQDKTQDPNLVEAIAAASVKFSELSFKRHATGASEYGPNTFLGKTDDELIDMLQEELADTANYSRYLFIKLEMVRIAMKERGYTQMAEGQFIPSTPGE